MSRALLLISCLSVSFFGLCQSFSYQSETLLVEPVSEHVLRHISYLDAGSFGRVACNGMIVFDEGEALVFDTPSDDTTATELIWWVEDVLKCKVKAVIPTHFHIDCLGGLGAFHSKGILSYASQKTIELAKLNDITTLPEKAFNDSIRFEVGQLAAYAKFFGEGHTKDNVIGILPKDQVIFGGCLVKSMGAGKGNLEDANITAWPKTMATITSSFSENYKIIPGHGNPGGTELLTYTRELIAGLKEALTH